MGEHDPRFRDEEFDILGDAETDLHDDPDRPQGQPEGTHDPAEAESTSLYELGEIKRESTTR